MGKQDKSVVSNPGTDHICPECGKLLDKWYSYGECKGYYHENGKCRFHCDVYMQQSLFFNVFINGEYKFFSVKNAASFAKDEALKRFPDAETIRVELMEDNDIAIPLEEQKEGRHFIFWKKEK